MRPAFSGACDVMGVACLEGEYTQCLFDRRDRCPANIPSVDFVVTGCGVV